MSLDPKKDALDAMRKGDINKAFDVVLNTIGFHKFLCRCGLTLLTPHIPHKIYLYRELIALKTKEGVRASLWISLDWINQAISVEIYDVLKETWKVNLE